MTEILSPEEFIRAPTVTSLYRPQSPVEGTVWRNPATGQDEIFSRGTWQTLQLSGILAVVNGGTGGSTAADARTNLGLGTMAVQNTASLAGFTFADAANIAFNTSTGTKIGTGTTQKFAFWNATPIAQPSSTGTTTGFTAGAGTAVDSAATFTGNVGSTAYTIGDIVKHLKNLGLIAS